MGKRGSEIKKEIEERKKFERGMIIPIFLGLISLLSLVATFGLSEAQRNDYIEAIRASSTLSQIHLGVICAGTLMGVSALILSVFAYYPRQPRVLAVNCLTISGLAALAYIYWLGINGTLFVSILIIFGLAMIASIGLKKKDPLGIK